jgi:peptidoglycan-associated lipoprotein
MKSWTLACLAGAALLAACSSDKNASSTSGGAGAGGDAASGYGAGANGAGGAGGAGGAAPGTQEDLVRAAGDRIFFDTDRTTLNTQALATLDKQSNWMRQNPQVSVWVAGNCDDRGTEEYNLALGQRRANADRDYLVAHGIERTRIETISYGKTRPIDPASTPEAWAQNRNAITSVK